MMRMVHVWSCVWLVCAVVVRILEHDLFVHRSVQRFKHIFIHRGQALEANLVCDGDDVPELDYDFDGRMSLFVLCGSP